MCVCVCYMLNYYIYYILLLYIIYRYNIYEGFKAKVKLSHIWVKSRKSQKTLT